MTMAHDYAPPADLADRIELKRAAPSDGATRRPLRTLALALLALARADGSARRHEQPDEEDGDEIRRV
jgi:hypothetical protein